MEKPKDHLETKHVETKAELKDYVGVGAKVEPKELTADAIAHAVVKPAVKPDPTPAPEPKTESVLAISPAGVVVKMQLHPGQKLKDGWKLAPDGAKYVDRVGAKELEASKLKAAGHGPGAVAPVPEKDKK